MATSLELINTSILEKIATYQYKEVAPKYSKS
jgi:hypothetical protein